MNGVRLCSTAALEWEPLGKGNVRQRVVRNDPNSGQFLGMMQLDALSRTGIHKHLDVAFAFHLAGSSTNYSAVVRPGQLGITLAGTVHDTVIYENALTIVRTEGRTMFPPPLGGEVHLHSGAVYGEMTTDPAQPSRCLTVVPESLELALTAVAGVSRRMLFDYASTGKNRRLVEFVALPQSATGPHSMSERLEIFVIAGDLCVNTVQAGPSDFVLVDAGGQIQWETRHGCRLLAWADGPSTWIDSDSDGAELYGFSS